MTPTHHPENSLEMMMMMKSERSEIAEKTHLPLQKTQQASVFCSGVTDDCKHGEPEEHFAEDDCDS